MEEGPTGLTLPDGGPWRVAGWALRELRSRKGGATLAGVMSWRNSPWRNAQERLTGVGWRGEGSSEARGGAGSGEGAWSAGEGGLDRPALGLRKRGRERGGLL